ncbi:MAG: SRPBCC domain-containing protein [Microcella sp.]|uniref:SRPBCC family protein n=1 Tax=Microcella sp. TaxID=1913979 RepID=UPI0024C8A4D9|nr:SRPBCC domain-containing protein [Microcella sp.]UYN84431.1 MAG: SRPBCC domain-containing protein [Microcella sp.]
MTFVSAEKDAANRTMTFIAEFDAPVERVWSVWSDRDTLERWWGPPEYPATISEFDFVAGGRMLYRMVGDPEGEHLDGRLRFISIDEPREIVYDEAFIPAEGDPDEQPLNRSVVTFEATGDVTRMTIITTFTSDEEFEQAVEFGALEGYEAGIGQIDAILAEKGTSA